MTDVLAAEWLKLRTVRSTFVVLAVVGIAMAGTCALAAYGAHTWDGLTASDREHFSLSPLESLFLVVAEMSMAVLGALTIGSEYAGGMIRDTLVAEPRRGRVLFAKAAVVGAVALAVGPACVFATSYLSRAIVGDRPIRAFTDASTHTTGLLLAQSLAVVVAALVGYGLGAALRSTTGAIVSLAGLLHVVPMVVQSLPAPWDRRVNSFTLDSLPGQLAGTGNAYSIYGSALPPAAAAGVMCAYVAAPLALATLRIHRRDA
ncbi:ABC transporter permease [Embleya sp. NBC_00896]|uniref:ABC transporter permease n=1 Tax=Embleya sp. NBC_00896 TaxID=2975961 RepID=UPI002F9152BE|nr:ABC transporter permease [Embleya sp. NBC_00896]